jgi:hypothetical protein
MKQTLLAVAACLFMFSICSADYAVQIGAFEDPANVNAAIERLKAAGFNPVIDPFTTRERVQLQVVMAGPYLTKKEADKAMIQLRHLGIKGFVRQYRPKKQLPIESKKPEVQQPPPPKVESQPVPEEKKQEPPPPQPEPEPQPAEPAPELSVPEIPEEEPTPVVFEDMEEGVRIHGFLQNEGAYTISDPDHGSKFKTRLELGLEGSFNENVKYKISGRADYDAIFALNDFYPENVRDDQEFEAMFRETYLDISAGDLDFRLGRQHIIWGEVIGLFFADVVSAKDLREFVLLDFDLIRIPQWAARVEYFKDDFHAEFIFIPYMTYDEIGVPGSEFYPFPPPPPPEFGAVILDERQPDNSIDNAAYGARLSILKGGWDVSGFYYGSVDASPFFSRQIANDPEPLFIYQPDHDRIQQMGITASKDFGPFIFKGEGIYTMDRWFNVDLLSDPDGIVQKDMVDYVLGLERPLPKDSRINIQFFQRWFPSHDQSMFFNEFETGVSFYVSTKAFHENVEPEGLVIYSLTRNDSMIRLKLNWYLQENWRLTGGADFLSGDPLGLFGRFDHSDRIYYELRYSF